MMLFLTRRFWISHNQPIKSKFFHVNWSVRKNHYDTLGVTRSASAEEIKSAYFKLCKEYHPDKHLNDNKKAKKFLEINNAYNVLSRERSRKDYDARLFSLHSSRGNSRTFHRNNPYHNPYSRYQHDPRQEFEFHRPKDPLNAYWDRFYDNKKMKHQWRRQNPTFNMLVNLQAKYINYFLVVLFILLFTRYIAQKQSREYQMASGDRDFERMEEVKERALHDFERRRGWKKEQSLKNETELEEA